MFSHAIVATDLGPSSEGIVACAGELGHLGVRDAVLVYSIALEREPSAADEAAFSRQIDSLEAAGIRVHVETPLGYPPHAIVALAEHHGAGVIVMGTSGRGLFDTGFSGSISSDVVRLSPVPVLLMPRDRLGDAASGSDACARMLGSVLVPVDVFGAGDRVCSLAFGLAPRGVGRMELLHITPFTFQAVREGLETVATRRLEALAERARDHGVREVGTTLVRGDAIDELPRIIASGNHTLVVLAPRAREAVDAELGSVASAVMRSSSIPMLLAPAEAGASAG